YWAEAARYEEIRDGAAVGTAAYLQPHLHRLRSNSRIFDVAQGHDDPGGLFGCGRRVRRSNDLDLRRRTADLSTHRSAGEWLTRAGPYRLHLHQRDVHAQENARMDGIGIPESGKRKAERN